MAAMTTARFDALQVPPKDPILGVKEEFLADAATDKINLSVGAYRTDEGTPWVLPPVAEARKRLIEGKLEHEYLPSTGLKSYCDRVDLLLRGKTSETSATVQGLSGTGGLRLCFEFLRRHHSPVVYVPAVTWSNHWNVLRDAGCDARPYAYLDGIRLDWPKLVADLEQAEEGAIILLHLCAHNPSGVDPTPQQWSQLCDLCKRKRFLPVFDSAYLGFASGDVDKDAAPFRLFCENGLQPWACISFSKNFGLYSERAGAIVASCASSREASAVRGHLGKLARALYSNPPAFGARVVDAVLADPALEARWRECLVVMSGRIADMRAKLRSALEARTARDWFVHCVGIEVRASARAIDATCLLDGVMVGVRAGPTSLRRSACSPTRGSPRRRCSGCAPSTTSTCSSRAASPWPASRRKTWSRSPRRSQPCSDRRRRGGVARRRRRRRGA